MILAAAFLAEPAAVWLSEGGRDMAEPKAVLSPGDRSKLGFDSATDPTFQVPFH